MGPPRRGYALNFLTGRQLRAESPRCCQIQDCVAQKKILDPGNTHLQIRFHPETSELTLRFTPLQPVLPRNGRGVFSPGSVLFAPQIEERPKRMFSSSRGLDSFDQYLQDVEKYPLIQDPKEERELARRAREGDKEAAERLVTANLRFVISYVKKYQGRGLGLAELVCIGNEGLLKAVKKFDPDKGVKFISYAVWWIRQTVLQALAEQTRSVRIPLNQNSNLAKLARTNTALTQMLGRQPTDVEISREMDEPVDTIRALRRVAASELSLDAPIDRGDRDSASFGERFAGAAAADIEEDVEAIARREFLETMFESYLTERERKILYLYYGLDDGEERTLEEIGSLLGVTRERIRQIRNRAFEKLRESPHGESLSGFWSTN